jgi:hypothetical protein
MFFPYLGSIHQHFLQDIQCALRPDTIGDSGCLSRRVNPSVTPLATVNIPTSTADTLPDIIRQNCGGTEISTSFGCTDISGYIALTKVFINWGFGIGGGIAFITTATSGFQIMFSRGDPQKFQSARQLFLASISGLLLLIFSAYIIRFLGVDLFQFLPAG